MNNEMNKTEEVFNEMPEKKAGFVASHKKAIIITALSILLVGCILFATVAYIVPAVKYGNALDDIENGNYKDAYITLKTLGNYKDSEKILRDFTLVYLKIESLNYDEYGDPSGTTFKTHYVNGKEREFSMYDEEGLLLEKREYNKNGDMLLYLRNRDDGTLLQNDYYEYFSDGKIRYHEIQSMSGREIKIAKTYYQYDENGKISVETRENDYGAESKTVYKYDANGRKIEVKEIDIYGKEQKTVYGYDENGKNTLKMIYNKSNELTEKCIWEYDANGKIILFVIYDKDDNVENKTEYAYDDHGNETLRVDYYQNGNVYYKTEKKFDDDSRLIYMIVYDENGDIRNQAEYTYNSDGKCIFCESCYRGIFTRSVIEYDGKGRETLSETYKRIDGGEEFLQNKITCEYDKYGNTILKTEYINYKDLGDQYGEETTETEYVLEYDEDGIVIKKTTYINGVMRYETTYTDPIVLYQPEGE